LAAIQKFQNLSVYKSSGVQAKDLLWDHNGSTAYLVVEGGSRKFFYKEPREGLLAAGARPDSLIFSGEATGGQYRGTAYIFNSRCGKQAYQVAGSILDNYRRVELRGRAPRLDGSCRPAGYVDDLLVFRLLEPAPPDDRNIAAPYSDRPAAQPPTEDAKKPETPPLSKEALLANIRSAEKIIENRLSELQNSETHERVAEIAARLATANSDMGSSELTKLQGDAKLATKIFEDADEFKRVSHVADDRLRAVNAVLEGITSDAPIIQELRSAMDEV